jgi:hypothetical protein
MVRLVKVLFFHLTCALPLLVSGQALEFGEAEPLPFNVNSDGHEILPLLSPDGKFLFISRSLYDLNIGGRYSGHDIWVAERSKKEWSRAINSYFPFNTRNNEAVIGMSRSGETVYFMKTTPNKRVNGVYVSKFVRGKWGEPALIPIEGLESEGSLGFFMHPDEDVLLISMKASSTRGEEDLYISTKTSKGEWSPVRNLGTAVNTKGTELSPFLSDDKRTLYFSSNGHKGLGDVDVFSATRLYDSWETWTTPQNLGEKVNTKKFDAYFSVYGDSVAYLASNRKGKHLDIFSVKISQSGPEREVILVDAPEVDSLIGKNVARKVVFSGRATALTANQRELLWYIANKLIGRKDVRIMLVPSQEDDELLTSNRLNAIVAQLAGAGIEGSRIRRSITPGQMASIAPLPEMPGKGEVRIVLIR